MSDEISWTWIGFLGICLVGNAPGFSFNLYGLPQTRDRKHMLLYFHRLLIFIMLRWCFIHVWKYLAPIYSSPSKLMQYNRARAGLVNYKQWGSPFYIREALSSAITTWNIQCTSSQRIQFSITHLWAKGLTAYCCMWITSVTTRRVGFSCTKNVI